MLLLTARHPLTSGGLPRSAFKGTILNGPEHRKPTPLLEYFVLVVSYITPLWGSVVAECCHVHMLPYMAVDPDDIQYRATIGALCNIFEGYIPPYIFSYFLGISFGVVTLGSTELGVIVGVLLASFGSFLAPT